MHELCSFPPLASYRFPWPFYRGRGGRRAASAPSPLFSMGWDFVNEQSRDTASFVRPPPWTTGEAQKKGQGSPAGPRFEGTPGFLGALCSPHICSPGGVVPTAFNGGGGASCTEFYEWSILGGSPGPPNGRLLPRMAAAQFRSPHPLVLPAGIWGRPGGQ